MNDQPALFEVDTPPVRVPKRPAAAGKVTWTAYKTQHGMPCDDCLAVLFEAKGEGPASRPARWRRAVRDAAGKVSDLLLCYAHADVRRAADGIEVSA